MQTLFFYIESDSEALAQLITNILKKVFHNCLPQVMFKKITSDQLYLELSGVFQIAFSV